MIEPYDRRTHARLIVELVQDDTGCGDPQENDNAGTLYSWTREFKGDEQIGEPDLTSALLLRYWFEDAALVIPLRYSNSHGACLYECDDEDANCALVFTRDEIAKEWGGHVEPKNENNLGARNYAKSRIEELDNWLRGNCWGIVIRDPETKEVLESVWGFIGDPDSDWIREEGDSMAEACAESIREETEERAYWMARDVQTVG